MKRTVLMLGTWLMAMVAMAQVQPGDTAYNVSVHAGYAHNLTYGSYANLDVNAYLPINKYFEAEAAVRVSTADTYSIGAQIRPKFALPVGELYLQYRGLLNVVHRDDYIDFVHAISAGYRMQYVNVQVGTFTRIITPLPYDSHLGDEMICEPFNLMYRVEAFVRPTTSPWNINLALANIDAYQMERMWQPMFYLGGWYNINQNWRVSLQGRLKLAGMFHLTAQYYGAELKAGVQYTFNQ